MYLFLKMTRLSTLISFIIPHNLVLPKQKHSLGKPKSSSHKSLQSQDPTMFMWQHCQKHSAVIVTIGKYTVGLVTKCIRRSPLSLHINTLSRGHLLEDSINFALSYQVYSTTNFLFRKPTPLVAVKVTPRNTKLSLYHIINLVIGLQYIPSLIDVVVFWSFDIPDLVLPQKKQCHYMYRFIKAD